MNTESFLHEAAVPVALDGWQIWRHKEVESTNSTASDLPAWSAVRACTQRNGRGRTGRPWVSDPGGLWISAVLPCPGQRARWAGLPMAVGWALIEALETLGASDLRLRWPNDILVGNRKLCGVLVERYSDATAVVGIGINVRNQPESFDPLLAGSTVRLVDLMPGRCDLDWIERHVLRALRRAHERLSVDGFPGIADRLNLTWGASRRVELTLSGSRMPVRGSFRGIDHHGRLRLADDRGAVQAWSASDVSLFREI